MTKRKRHAQPRPDVIDTRVTGVAGCGGRAPERSPAPRTTPGCQSFARAVVSRPTSGTDTGGTDAAEDATATRTVLRPARLAS
jgi:hypothetical protein